MPSCTPWAAQDLSEAEKTEAPLDLASVKVVGGWRDVLPPEIRMSPGARASYWAHRRGFFVLMGSFREDRSFGIALHDLGHFATTRDPKSLTIRNFGLGVPGKADPEHRNSYAEVMADLAASVLAMCIDWTGCAEHFGFFPLFLRPDGTYRYSGFLARGADAEDLWEILRRDLPEELHPHTLIQSIQNGILFLKERQS